MNDSPRSDGTTLVGDHSALRLKRTLEEGAAPLWTQLKILLTERIAGGELRPHDQLPSEAELCRVHGVSRTVVREALNQLVIERRIYKMQGKGSFVSAPRQQQDFVGSNVSFTSDFEGTGHIVTRRVLNFRRRQADAEDRRKLQLGPDDQVVELERVLCVDGVPRTLVVSVMNATLTPAFENIDMDNRSLYDTLKRRYGIVMSGAERWLEAVNADERAAKYLEVEEGTALLSIDSIGVEQTRTPVEHYRALHRTDTSRLRLRIA